MSGGDSKGVWPSVQRPASWETADFEEVFVDATDSRKKVKQKDYEEGSELPVVDQGQATIGGFTSRLDMAYRGALPVVVFGDHTRATKFIDHAFAQGADGVKVLQPRLDPRFSYFALRTVSLPNKGYSRHFKFLRATEFPVPPLDEQRRIVDKVDALFAHSKKAKESLDRIPALLEKLKKSILAAAFRGDLTKDWREAHPDVEPADKLLDRIRTERRHRWEEAELTKMRAKGQEPKDDRWKQKYKEPEPVDTTGLPELPQGWVWASLNELSLFVTDGDHNPPKRVPNGVPHLTAKNIKNWRVNLEGCSFLSAEGFEKTRKRYEPRAGDIIITCVGTLGETAIVPRDCAFSADRNLAAARLVPNGAEAKTVLYALNTLRAQQLMGAVSGHTAQPHVYLADLRAVPIPLPPAEEQLAINRSIEGALSILRHCRSVAQGAALRSARLDQAILARAFRGELVPQDPNDEPASVLLERIRAEREAAAPVKKARWAGWGKKKKTTSEPIPPPEPEPPTTARPSTPPPAQSSLPFDEQFLELGPREQAQALATAIFGAGPLPKADALRLAADGLRELGLSDHQRLRTGGKLHTALEKALTNGVRYEFLDRPARGEVRAIKPDPKTWTETDWSLVAAAVPPTDDLDAWVREAATWAAHNCGLQFTRLRTGGHIDRNLRIAAQAPTTKKGI